MLLMQLSPTAEYRGRAPGSREQSGVGTEDEESQLKFIQRNQDMANCRSVRRAVRLALATATAAAGVTALHAQQNLAATEPGAAPAVQEIVVTGSRLQVPNDVSISPISTVTAAAVEQTGLARVEDILNALPMV